MLSLKNKVLMALSLCGGFVLEVPPLSHRPATKKDATSWPYFTERKRVLASEQPTSRKPLLHTWDKAPKLKREHSAEATAHKSVNDPNNQLGTSLQGRTRPVAGADVGSQNDTASTGTPPETGAQ